MRVPECASGSVWVNLVGLWANQGLMQWPVHLSDLVAQRADLIRGVKLMIRSLIFFYRVSVVAQKNTAGKKVASSASE